MQFCNFIKRKLVFGSAIAAFVIIFSAWPAFAGSIVGWGDQVVVGDLNSGFTKVAAGSSQSLGLKQDGSIVAWGDNTYGQCNMSSPNTDFTAVVAGGLHGLGLKQDGSIVAWGDNTYGQCNILFPNTEFTAVAAGGYHSLGLKQDGSIVAWGRNDYGQCNVPEPNTGFVAVAAGYEHSIGLKEDGSIVCWGRNIKGQCNVPEPNADFVAIAAGGLHSIGLKQDSSIVAWGDNTYGECNIPSPNAGFIAIAANGYHCIGLKEDGSIVAWGRNVYGQCNVPEPNTGFVAVAAGYEHSIGIKDDGSVVGWGRNNKSQCNIPLPNTDFIVIAAGGHHNLGLKLEGTILAWGDNTYDECNVPWPNADFIDIDAGEYFSIGIKRDGSIVAWGRNDYNQCDVPAPNIDFVAISAGFYHCLGLKQDGNVVAWGENLDGECNVPWSDANFVAVAAGGHHSLGLKQDGSIVAWGRNDYNQCSVPWPNTGFIAVAAADAHSMGLKDDGSVVAWGRNDYNQCNVPTPNTDFIAIDAGGDHSFGLKEDGSIVAWGRNDYGQCNPSSPNTGYVAVKAGLSCGLALTGVPGAPTGSFSGVLYDFVTGKPMAGATVIIAGGPSVQTDQDGKFSFGRVSVGDVMITVAEAGYFFTTITSAIDPRAMSSGTIGGRPMPDRYLGDPPGYLSIIDPLGSVQIKGDYFNESSHCYFLNGVNCNEKIDLTIAWGGRSPGWVQWIRPDGTVINEDDVRNSANPGTVSRTFDMGNDIGLGQLSVDVLDSSGKSIFSSISAGMTCIPSKGKTANFKVIDPPTGIPASYLKALGGKPLKYINKTPNNYIPSFIQEGVGNNIIPGSIPYFGVDSFLFKLEGPVSVTVDGEGNAYATTDPWSPWEKVDVAGYKMDSSVTLYISWDYMGKAWGPPKTDTKICSKVGDKWSAPPEYLWYVPPIYIKASLNCDFNTCLIIHVFPADFESIVLYFGVGAEVAIGTGIYHVIGAEAYLGGGAEMWLQFPDTPHLQSLCVNLNGGVRLFCQITIFGLKIVDWEKNYGLHYSWCENLSAGYAMAPLSMTPADIDEFQIMGRNYLGPDYAVWVPAIPKQERLTTLEGEEQTPPEPNEEQLLQFNVFDYSQPSISADGNDMLLAWVYDDPNRDPCEPNSVNRTEVIFSRCIDGNWTEPGPIDDDGTADFSAKIIALADGNALCVWDNTKENMPNDVNLTDMAAAMEIKAAHYDSSSGEWSPTTLTDNNHLDLSPQIAAGDNGTAIAVWIYNEGDDILGLDPNALNEIRYSFWDGLTWSEPNTVAAGIGLILKTDLAYNGNEAVYVYSLDADCNMQTETDQELYAVTYNYSGWSLPYRITDDNLFDANPQVIYDQNDIFLVWGRDTNIVSCCNLEISNVQEILVTSGSSAEMDFRLAKSPAGHKSLLWAETSDEGTDIFTATYDPDLSIWSEPYQITSDRQMERSMSVTYTGSGKLVVAYNKVEIIDINDVPEPNRVDLCMLRHTIRGDLAIAAGDVSLSVPNPMPGSTIDINAVIHNAGDVGEVNVPVEFYNGDPNTSGVLIGSQTIPGPIPAGDTTIASVPWLVPEVNEPQQIYVVIDPDFEIEDANRNNNVASLQVMAADLTVAHVISERIGPKIRAITARIANTGGLPVENVTVTIRRDSETGSELANLDINRIEPNSFYDVWHLWNIAAEEFNDVEIEICVAVDEPDYISESDENNNAFFSVVKVGKITDVTDDGAVDFADLYKFINQWLDSCDTPDWCECSDFNRSGRVDFIDFAAIMDDWLWQASW